MMCGANVTAIALEFGTVGPLQVLEALRADNWLRAHSDPLSPNGRAIKDQITNAFYLDNDVWRGMVLGQRARVSSGTRGIEDAGVRSEDGNFSPSFLRWQERRSGMPWTPAYAGVT
jgi:Protein of unknown function (DUF2817)